MNAWSQLAALAWRLNARPLHDLVYYCRNASVVSCSNVKVGLRLSTRFMHCTPLWYCRVCLSFVRRHGWRLALNVAFLLLLVVHKNAALKECVAVTELSPGRLFHLVAPAGRSRALKFAPSSKTSFSRQYQRLYQSVRANYNHEESRATNLLTATAIDWEV